MDKYKKKLVEEKELNSEEIKEIYFDGFGTKYFVVTKPKYFFQPSYDMGKKTVLYLYSVQKKKIGMVITELYDGTDKHFICSKEEGVCEMTVDISRILSSAIAKGEHRYKVYYNNIRQKYIKEESYLHLYKKEETDGFIYTIVDVVYEAQENTKPYGYFVSTVYKKVASMQADADAYDIVSWLSEETGMEKKIDFELPRLSNLLDEMELNDECVIEITDEKIHTPFNFFCLEKVNVIANEWCQLYDFLIRNLVVKTIDRVNEGKVWASVNLIELINKPSIQEKALVVFGNQCQENNGDVTKTLVDIISKCLCVAFPEKSEEELVSNLLLCFDGVKPIEEEIK